MQAGHLSHGQVLRVWPGCPHLKHDPFCLAIVLTNVFLSGVGDDRTESLICEVAVVYAVVSSRSIHGEDGEAGGVRRSLGKNPVGMAGIAAG